MAGFPSRSLQHIMESGDGKKMSPADVRIAVC